MVPKPLKKLGGDSIKKKKKKKKNLAPTGATTLGIMSLIPMCLIS